MQMLPPGSCNTPKSVSKTGPVTGNCEATTTSKTKQQLRSIKKNITKSDKTEGDDDDDDANTEIDDVTDFKIQMLEDRCKRLENNLNDMKKQRDVYAATVRAISEYCESNETAFSRQIILSIVRIAILRVLCAKDSKITSNHYYNIWICKKQQQLSYNQLTITSFTASGIWSEVFQDNASHINISKRSFCYHIAKKCKTVMEQRVRIPNDFNYLRHNCGNSELVIEEGMPNSKANI
uniref:THAP-type domain-containing protein n=1 Tax=Syphacia muris TaxID=451379 RepID=A0A158R549_9BILA